MRHGGYRPQPNTHHVRGRRGRRQPVGARTSTVFDPGPGHVGLTRDGRAYARTGSGQLVRAPSFDHAGFGRLANRNLFGPRHGGS